MDEEMTQPKLPLGKLEEVNLRDYWEHEAHHFTPWLAADENLQLLSEAIGVPLELVKQEVPVGPYSADLLCRIPPTDHRVLIENQLEKTDHSHLGQLLTYAAGLEAVSIIWIAAKFTDEHRAALDWLNRMTREGINFFGIEIELWKIVNSPAAPRFNVIAQPNDWAKHVSSVIMAGNTELSPTEKQCLAYWQSFNQFVEAQKSMLKPVNPSKDNYLVYGTGNGKLLLEAIVGFKDGWVGSRLSFNDKTLYPLLAEQREAIETEAGHPFEWIPESGRVVLKKHANLSNASAWPELHAWQLKALEKTIALFSPRVNALKQAASKGA